MVAVQQSDELGGGLSEGGGGRAVVDVDVLGVEADGGLLGMGEGGGGGGVGKGQLGVSLEGF